MKYKIALISLLIITSLSFGATHSSGESIFQLSEALDTSPLSAFVLAFNGLIIITSIYFIVKITVEVWRQHIIHG